MLIRRSALEAAGGFSELPVAQDWDTWLEIAKRFPIGFIDEVVALVRRHTNGITLQGGRERIDVQLAIVDRHLRRRPTRPGSGRCCAAARPRPPACTPGSGSAIQGHKRVARRYAIEALALDPFTLARRKLALLARVFVSESLVARLSHALQGRRAPGQGAHRPSGREARCVTSAAARSAA